MRAASYSAMRANIPNTSLPCAVVVSMIPLVSDLTPTPRASRAVTMSIRSRRLRRPGVQSTTPEDLEALESDVLAGFVLARAAAGLADGTIAADVMHLEQVRAWFGRPLWEMEPARR